MKAKQQTKKEIMKTRLIAAAPELLAACEYALALALGNIKGDRYDLQNTMQAVIAKARGPL